MASINDLPDEILDMIAAEVARIPNRPPDDFCNLEDAMLKSIENLQAAAGVSWRWRHIFAAPRYLEACKTAYKSYMSLKRENRFVESMMNLLLITSGTGVLRYAT